MNLNKPVSKLSKSTLLTVSLIILALSLTGLICGIVFLVRNIINFNIIAIILFLLLIVVSGFALIIGVIWISVALSMIDGDGSVKDGNRAIGTQNANLCPRCGREVDVNSKFCGNCNQPMEQNIICPNCNQTVDAKNKFCPSCGKQVKD